MTSEAYEDNFQLCSVSKLKNLGVENNVRKLHLHDVHGINDDNGFDNHFVFTILENS